MAAEIIKAAALKAVATFEEAMAKADEEMNCLEREEEDG
jgi:hypothetical protein